MLTNYDTWPRDKLIARLIELEEIVCPAEAEDLINRIPLAVAPVPRQMLAIIYAASPKYVSTADLQTAIWGDMPSSRIGSIKTQMCGLRKTLRGWGVEIKSSYGRGYKLPLEHAKLLKEKILGVQS